MRLICPKCGAEYEPPRNMVPSGGRYVQCSACHTRWFAKGNSPPRLTEDQIIARLESRAPNLKVVEEPLAAPWASRSGAEKPEGPPAPKMAVVSEPDETEAEDQPIAGSPRPQAPSDFDFDPPSEPELEAETEAKAQAAPSPVAKGEEGFAWEAPEPAAEDKAQEDAPADFAFEQPDKPKNEAGFTWAEPKETGEKPLRGSLSRKAGAPENASMVEKVRPASQNEVRPASQSYPLRDGRATQKVEVVHPRIIIHEQPKSRFWAGFGVAVAIFAVLILIYFAAQGLQGPGTGVEAAARTYIEFVDAARRLIAELVPGR